MKTFVPPANGVALRSLFTLRHTKLYSLRRVWAMLVTVLPRLVAELHAEIERRHILRLPVDGGSDA